MAAVEASNPDFTTMITGCTDRRAPTDWALDALLAALFHDRRSLLQNLIPAHLIVVGHQCRHFCYRKMMWRLGKELGARLSDDLVIAHHLLRTALAHTAIQQLETFIAFKPCRQSADTTGCRLI